MSVKIHIDPTSRILYSSFYIYGLYKMFGESNVSFNSEHFKTLNRHNEDFSFNHYFAFVKIDNGNIKRFVVDFCDPEDISELAYEWCDVYAKINTTSDVQVKRSKLVMIPPGFGIRIWNLPLTALYCFQNALRSYTSNRLPVSLKTLMQDYWQQYKRLKLKDYFLNANTRKNYVFLLGTLWNHDDNANQTNKFRISFMKACHENPEIIFEGGLVADENHPNYNSLRNYTVSKPYTLKSYYQKTTKSAIVFNTPAVHNCHGWKLAEFLAMGKPIISTPLYFDMACKLTHGKEIHFVSDESEINSAIKLVLSNDDYRTNLGLNAADYFLQNATPLAVIKAIVSKKE